jgi:uncharacterized protein (TIGR03437 family)
MRALILLLCAVFPVLLSAQTPSIVEGGVLNAASFARGQVISRGSLVTIFGTELASSLAQANTIPLSTSLSDVTVLFNGIPAPMLLVAPGTASTPSQINAQVPWELLGGGGSSGTASVVVRRGNVSSAPREFQIGPASPGIFSIPPGVGAAVAVNADGSIAAPENSIQNVRTRPAVVGETIILYATGLGQVDPPGRTGNDSRDTLRRNTATPTVLIGGREAQVAFSGLAPEFVGVNQLNVVVPSGVQSGVVPIQIRSGDITTTDQVTIAVRAP